MLPQTVSQTIRVYCTDFSIGNPDDHDGETGSMPPLDPRLSGAYPVIT
jgi:hypothetical protein